MKKNYVKIVLLVLLFCTGSCQRWVADKYLPNRPHDNFEKDMQDASPEFRQGWNDGCEVGMAAGSNVFYKSFYKSNKVDGYKMTSSGEYKTAWGNAFWYCYRYDEIKTGDSHGKIWSSIFGGYQ